MNYIDRAISTSLEHLYITNVTDPGTLGLLRENAVIAITGAFGVTSKTVIQRHLGLSRESVNKLINRMKKKQLINVHPTFSNMDKGFILLTSHGAREAEFILNRELHLRSDVSRVNERNLIHDLSVQIVVLDLVKAKEISGFATERDLAIQLEHRANDARLVDALIVDSNSGHWIGIEMETSNAKNKANGELRKKILSKYLQELENEKGLYESIYMYSHRQRFLTQIEKTHAKIFARDYQQFSKAQRQLLSTQIKFKASECETIFELMFDSNRQLSKDNIGLIRKSDYLHQLKKLEKLVQDTNDRIIEIRLDGYKEAGKVSGLLD
ncbi:hypothetical protein [Paraglaciecola sp. 20A4]|uniref:hypothetical protein n=1 Tax=Paraglaciecola sp. 20A4 TaxID=2687288 RepID=UPI0014092261|nr:hypothetical protein [Paraglaciecola sp. 20A4]